MDDIKVSVCMTTYNHERYIAQAVESVLAQRISFPIEIVVGEDGSSDRTQKILRDFAEQHPDAIRLYLNERNIGGKANFMATKARCRGRYIAMLEGDDYWTCADKLQRQVDALDAHPEWAMCFHPCACQYEDGLQGVPIYPIGWTKQVSTIEDLFLSNFLPTSSVLFRNRLFPEFPDWFRELLIGDWPLHILNAVHGDIGFLPEVMSAYRIHGCGVWSGAMPVERIISVFELFTAIDHHFEGKYTRSINKYREDTIRYVMAQLDATTQQVAGMTDQLRSFQSQAELQSRTHALTQAQETDKIQRLQAFYDIWSKSIAYRVEREIRRPFQRLRRYWQNRRNGSAQAPPSGTATSNAA